MSLELEIKNLTQAIKALTDELCAARTAPQSQEEKKESPKVEKAKKPVEVEKKETPKVEEVKKQELSPTDNPVTEQDLQALCMKIVQADRSKGGSIKTLLANYDGAKTVKQVSADHYDELKEKLEDIQNG